MTAAAAGVIALATFLAVEVRAADTALVPPRLLRARHIALGNLATLLAGVALNPMWHFLALAMRDLLSFSPLQTGLGFLPDAVLTLAVGILVTPRLMRRVPARLLVRRGPSGAPDGGECVERCLGDGVEEWRLTETPGANATRRRARAPRAVEPGRERPGVGRRNRSAGTDTDGPPERVTDMHSSHRYS